MEIALLIFCCLGLGSCMANFGETIEHNNQHLTGYEIVRSDSDIDIFTGDSVYYDVVRYEDGCVKKIYITEKEYLERIEE